MEVKVIKVRTQDLGSNQGNGSLSLNLNIKVKVKVGESESDQSADTRPKKQSVQWVSQPQLKH